VIDHDEQGTGQAGPSGTDQSDGELVDEQVAEQVDGVDDEHVDELPEDLDAAGFVGAYTFPNNSRRRAPGYLYLMIAVACLVIWLATRSHQPVLANGGMLAAAIGLAAVGVYHLVAGRNLDVDERDALVTAARTVGFAVGHASAQMSWRGVTSRPTWRILLYSAESPPKQRGLVLVDGCDGEVVSWFVEDNPEDWSDLRDDLASVRTDRPPG
jgi:hypothetical protein